MKIGEFSLLSQIFEPLKQRFQDRVEIRLSSPFFVYLLLAILNKKDESKGKEKD